MWYHSLQQAVMLISVCEWLFIFQKLKNNNDIHFTHPIYYYLIKNLYHSLEKAWIKLGKTCLTCFVWLRRTTNMKGSKNCTIIIIIMGRSDDTWNLFCQKINEPNRRMKKRKILSRKWYFQVCCFSFNIAF